MESSVDVSSPFVLDEFGLYLHVSDELQILPGLSDLSQDRVTEAEVREYQRACETVEAEARDVLAGALRRLDIADDASWTYVLETVARLYSEYGRAFAELGRQFYQWCRDVQSDGRGTFVAETFWDDGGHAPLADAVRTHLGDLASDRKTEGVAAEAIANSLSDFAFKAGRDAIRGNLNAEWQTRRSSSANVGFARVPRVGCTCAFCRAARSPRAIRMATPSSWKALVGICAR